MTSTEIIENAKDKFKELGHKDYEWRSFYNGYLIGYSNAHSKVEKLDIQNVTNIRLIILSAVIGTIVGSISTAIAFACW